MELKNIEHMSLDLQHLCLDFTLKDVCKKSKNRDNFEQKKVINFLIQSGANIPYSKNGKRVRKNFWNNVEPEIKEWAQECWFNNKSVLMFDSLSKMVMSDGACHESLVTDETLLNGSSNTSSLAHTLQ